MDKIQTTFSFILPAASVPLFHPFFVEFFLPFFYSESAAFQRPVIIQAAQFPRVQANPLDRQLFDARLFPAILFNWSGLPAWGTEVDSSRVERGSTGITATSWTRLLPLPLFLFCSLCARYRGRWFIGSRFEIALRAVWLLQSCLRVVDCWMSQGVVLDRCFFWNIPCEDFYEERFIVFGSIRLVKRWR